MTHVTQQTPNEYERCIRETVCAQITHSHDSEHIDTFLQSIKDKPYPEILNKISRELNRDIHIQRIDFDNDWQPGDFNTNNHPCREDDIHTLSKIYDVEIEKTNLHRWAHIIDYPVLCEYTFTDANIRDLNTMMGVSIITMQLSKLHNSEFENIQTNINNLLQANPSESGYFVRFTGASPKDGVYGLHALMNAGEIITQIITSERAYRQLKRKHYKLYIMKYNKSWDSRRELRVFVHEGFVTAISQYACTNPHTVFQKYNDIQLNTVAHNVLATVSGKLDLCINSFDTNSFVVDIYVEADLSVWIIEFNTFGYTQASGSALYHWIKDYNILYGSNGNDVYFRIYN